MKLIDISGLVAVCTVASGFLALGCATATVGDYAPWSNDSSNDPSTGHGGIGNNNVEVDDNLVACVWDQKKPKRAGVDIVFVIDNSHSMIDETQKVMANINKFAATIASSKLDYQVIMLSAKGTNLTDFREDVENLKGSGLVGDVPIEVCVPPPLGIGPLGSDPCGDNPPLFHHLDHYPFGIASRNGMWLAASMYNPDYTWADDSGPPGGGWAKWARYDAVKYFVVVTDDDATVPGLEQGDASVIGNASEPWEIFDRLILNDPRFGPHGMFGTEQNRKYVYNTVCGLTYPGHSSNPASLGGGCKTNDSDPDYNSAMSPGLQHQKLAQLTGGIALSICDSDWSSVIGKLADHLVEEIGCEFSIPVPDEGTTDPNAVLVRYTRTDGSTETLTRVTNESKCSQYATGWHYDNETAPTKIVLCPAACETIGKANIGQIDVLMGCEAPSPK